MHTNNCTGAVDLDTNSVENLIQKLTAALEDPHVTQIEFVPFISSVNSEYKERIDSGHCNSFAYHPFLVGDGCLGIPMQTMPSILKILTINLRNLVAGITSDSVLEISLGVVEKLCGITLCILTLNSDHHTAWNWRKRMLRDGHITVEKEIRFLDIFSSNKRHCKSSLYWQHRRILVNMLLSEICSEHDKNRANNSLCKHLIDDIWQHESGVCKHACEKYLRNYHCWVYRWWCLHRLYDTLVGHDSASTQIFIDEMDLTVKWIESHPADYAACHYLHLLVYSTKGLNSSVSFVCKNVVSACYKNTETSIMTLYSEYESVWNHRRWCTKAMVEYKGKAVVFDEFQFVNSIISKHSNSQQAVELAEKHRGWLNAEFCF